MRAGFYPKLALDGIRKNKRMYVPYILTCIGMVMMHYIIEYLAVCKAVTYLPGASFVQSTLGFGGWVIAIFATIFLFYTNAFLIRRRKKEFGLYNILGMGKWNISRILFWEYMITAAVSLGAGLLAGIAFSKLAELGLIRVMNGKAGYSMSVSPAAIVHVLIVFAAIFVLLYLNTVRQIRANDPIALLRSENVGEKPPKANWFFGIAGVVILGIAYYLAVSIDDPLVALAVFFVAVVLVIIGTYLIFIAGSVFLCRLFQKNKRYYYKANHFVSVSSMAYRMKRNGAGLASVCILATMVLVMISSTSCLYAGSEDVLNTRYPRDLNVTVRLELDDPGRLIEESARLKEEFAAENEECGAVPDHVTDLHMAYAAGMFEGDTLETDITKVDASMLEELSDMVMVYVIPLADYNSAHHTQETLAENEVLVYGYRMDYEQDTFAIRGGRSFLVKKHLKEFTVTGNSAMDVMPSMYVVVPDFAKAMSDLVSLADYNGNQMFAFEWTYAYDTGLSGEEQVTLRQRLSDRLMEHTKEWAQKGSVMTSCESKGENRQDFLVTFGSLLFLGIILSIVFIFAAVLIIYYKQISEGYEDEARFEIMQKVGMTRPEIRKSINAQLLTVFFLPLLAAGCHLAFAFPIVQKLLLCFNFTNAGLFAVTTVICFVVFAVLYTIVYRVTSNAYYKIVSGVS